MAKSQPKEGKTMAYEKLFEPIQVGSVTVRNRYAYAPTNTSYIWKGVMNEQEIAYYTARAMGGTGMVIVGAYLSTKIGQPYIQRPWMFVSDITHVPDLATVAENIQLGGATAVLQLLPFPGSGGRNLSDLQPIAPSPVPYLEPPGWRSGGGKRPNLLAQRLPNSKLGTVGNRAPDTIPREATWGEIQTIISENAYACKLAAWAGWDGIELHMCHTYFVDSFRNPLSNKRTDSYGGSEENRNRLLLEIAETSIRAAREENPNIVIGVRLGAECGPGGYTFEETKRLALQLQEMGIQYHHVTWGVLGPAPHTLPYQDGILLQYGRELKKILKIPVITSAIHDPKLAEQAVAEGQTDMVSTGHMLMADPEFCNKLKEGREDEIIWCNMCGQCHRGGLVPGIRCILNPETGREKYNPKYQLWKGFTGADFVHPALRRK